MGLLSFLSQKTEEKIHQELSLILTEYHKLKAMIEREKALTEQLDHIHKRIDAINSAIRHATTLPLGHARTHYLQQLAQSERALLEVQKSLAGDIEHSTRSVIQLEEKRRQMARKIKDSS